MRNDPKMNVIEVRDLTKVFGTTTAVDHIAFDVRQGEIFGFLGPNGAGKTTTTRMLTCVIPPDVGTATVLGHDIRSEPVQAKQGFGVVPETSNAYTDFTAWQNLMLMGELYGLTRHRAAQRSSDLLGMVGLLERKDQKVQAYSKGMKQRLILAMALIHEPELLFLDEPTSGLDVQSTQMILSLLRDLNRQGTTIFLTTHNNGRGKPAMQPGRHHKERQNGRNRCSGKTQDGNRPGAPDRSEF